MVTIRHCLQKASGLQKGIVPDCFLHFTDNYRAHLRLAAKINTFLKYQLKQ